jgi:hypothetical protein
MTKYYYSFLCLLAFGLFSSCDDEKEVIPPVVQIESPSVLAKLHGIVTITALATDDTGISIVRILIDETILHESAEGEVSHDWDTETVSDGTHTLSVVATDVDGNEGTETLTVEVFNDKKAPQITLTSPVTQPFVKSIIKIEGSVADESAIETINIFVGDVLLTSLTNTNAFSFDWDTKTVTDGNHTIRITAIDNQANETSVTREVKVFNYFITLNVVNPLVPSDVKFWYLISTYDGTLIQTKPYVPAETKIRFETPDNFNADERYVLSTFQYIDKFEDYPAQIRYLAEGGFPPGESTVSPRHIHPSSGSTTHRKTHTMTIQNVPTFAQVFLSGTTGSVATAVNKIARIEMDFYANTLNSYVSLSLSINEVPRFKYFSGLQDKGTTQSDFNDFTPMVGNTLAALPNATFTSGYVYGITASEYNQSNPLWGYVGMSKLEHYLYNPPGTYLEYIYAARENAPNETNFFQHIGAQAPSAVLRSNGTVNSYTMKERTLTLQTSGVYDMVSVTGSLYKDFFGERTLYHWSVQFPDGNNHSITIPQLPSALAIYEFPDLGSIAFTSAYFIDYSGFNGYQKMRNFQLANPEVSLYTVSKDYVTKTIALPSTGGRLKNDLFDQTLKIMAENARQMGLSPYEFRE